MPHPWKHSRPGWMGSEQPDPGEDVPGHCRGVGLDGLERSPPTQTILWFHDSMIKEGLCSGDVAVLCPVLSRQRFDTALRWLRCSAGSLSSWRLDGRCCSLCCPTLTALCIVPPLQPCLGCWGRGGCSEGCCPGCSALGHGVRRSPMASVHVPPADAGEMHETAAISSCCRSWLNGFIPEPAFLDPRSSRCENSHLIRSSERVDFF